MNTQTNMKPFVLFRDKKCNISSNDENIPCTDMNLHFW